METVAASFAVAMKDSAITDVTRQMSRRMTCAMSVLRRSFWPGLPVTSGPLIVPVSAATFVSGSWIATSDGVFLPFILLCVSVTEEWFRSRKKYWAGVFEQRQKGEWTVPKESETLDTWQRSDGGGAEPVTEQYGGNGALFVGSV